MTSASTTPLLSLLDALLSQDEIRARQASDDLSTLVEHETAGQVRLPPVERLEHCGRDGADSIIATLPYYCHVVQVVLQHVPHLARTKSAHDGSLPLHFAASLGHAPMAQVLFDSYPTAACTPNGKSKIPLHYAAREGQIAVVRYLLDACPECARIATDKLKLALHFAAGDGHVSTVQALLQSYPKGASMASAKGKLPLHFAARWGHLQIAHELLVVHPAGIHTRDWDGSLPLHDACREGKYRMCRFLVEQYPEALAVVNLRNEIPLFPAVRSAHTALVAFLLQAWPAGANHVLQGVNTKDEPEQDILELLLRGAAGCLQDCPLLHGLEPATVFLTLDSTEDSLDSSPALPSSCQGSQMATMRFKVVKHPAPVSTESCVPKLIASRYNPIQEVMMPHPVFALSIPRSKSPVLGGDVTNSKKLSRKRSRQYDDCPVRQPRRSFLPLHAALQAKASIRVLRIVYSQCDPNVIDIRDEYGRLPLHWAVALLCRPRDNVVDSDSDGTQMMIDFTLNHLLTPQAALVRDNENCLPLHMALSSRAHIRIIEALLQANTSAAVHVCQTYDEWMNQMPLHMACHYDCDLSTVYRLLRVDPSFIQKSIR